MIWGKEVIGKEVIRREGMTGCIIKTNLISTWFDIDV